MFYGIIREQYNYDIDILQEFDLKGTIDTIRKKIKNAILKLIDKIDAFLDKCGDNKITSVLKSLLSKLRSLLTKTDNIKNEKDAKRAFDEYNQYTDEFYGTYNDYKFTIDWNDAIKNKNWHKCRIVIAGAIKHNQDKIARKLWNDYKSKNPDGISTDDSILKKFEDEFDNTGELEHLYFLFQDAEYLNDDVFDFVLVTDRKQKYAKKYENM